MLGTSERPGFGFLFSGTRNGTRASRSVMTEIFMRKVTCQLNVSIIQPPAIGPAAARSAPIARISGP